MINIEPQHLAIVKSLLQQHIPDYEVRIFGSRAKGQPKSFSDLDLVIMNQHPLPLSILANLNLAFEESTLPYKVDLVEWCALNPEFQARINAKYEVL